jgi:predicted RNA-binding protein with EMAP domain
MHFVHMMDPNLSYLLKIKLFGNPKCVRKEISYICFEKVVDSDTTNFKDFVDEIVDKFPPGFNDVVTVQYYDDDVKLFPQVKIDQELQVMFVKHAETKVVNMCVAYAETPHLISQWPISPLKKGDISAVAVSSIPTNEIDQQHDNDLDDDAYLMNLLPENEFVGVDEEGMYLGRKKVVVVLDVLLYANDDNVPEEDFDSWSEFEEELKDSAPDHLWATTYSWHPHFF